LLRCPNCGSEKFFIREEKIGLIIDDYLTDLDYTAEVFFLNRIRTKQNFYRQNTGFSAKILL
jgi:hypothetical protein